MIVQLNQHEYLEFCKRKDVRIIGSKPNKSTYEVTYVVENIPPPPKTEPPIHQPPKQLTCPKCKATYEEGTNCEICNALEKALAASRKKRADWNAKRQRTSTLPHASDRD